MKTMFTSKDSRSKAVDRIGLKSTTEAMKNGALDSDNLTKE